MTHYGDDVYPLQLKFCLKHERDRLINHDAITLLLNCAKNLATYVCVLFSRIITRLNHFMYTYVLLASTFEILIQHNVFLLFTTAFVAII